MASLLGLGGAFDQLHAVLFGVFLDRALAASTGMNLGLHHPSGCPGFEKLPGGAFRCFASLHHFSTRHRDPILLQDFFRLVLVNFHNISRFSL